MVENFIFIWRWLPCTLVPASKTACWEALTSSCSSGWWVWSQSALWHCKPLIKRDLLRKWENVVAGVVSLISVQIPCLPNQQPIPRKYPDCCMARTMNYGICRRRILHPVCLKRGSVRVVGSDVANRDVSAAYPGQPRRCHRRGHWLVQHIRASPVRRHFMILWCIPVIRFLMPWSVSFQIQCLGDNIRRGCHFWTLQDLSFTFSEAETPPLHIPSLDSPEPVHYEHPIAVSEPWQAGTVRVWQSR